VEIFLEEEAIALTGPRIVRLGDSDVEIPEELEASKSARFGSVSPLSWCNVKQSPYLEDDLCDLHHGHRHAQALRGAVPKDQRVCPVHGLQLVGVVG
jgi:hypothetical protein